MKTKKKGSMAKKGDDNFCTQVASCEQKFKINKNCICRIVVDCKEFNYCKPYDESNTNSSSGTGFFLDGFTAGDGSRCPLVITAYHVVHDAVNIRVLIESVSSEFMRAVCVGANCELDVAILKLADPSACTIDTLPVGDSDTCYPTQKIQAVGFGLGKPWIQSTVGVISGRTDTHIQIDAAVNEGNSGGPVMCASNGKVIGIVLAGVVGRAQNVNYICPINEAIGSFQRLLAPASASSAPSTACRRDNSANLGIAYMRVNPCFLKSVQSPSGVLCTHINRYSPFYESALRTGDVLCALNGFDIDIQGRFQPDGFWPDKLPLNALRERLPIGKSVPFRFFSVQDRATKEGSVVFDASGSAVTYRTLYPEFDRVCYSAFGGLVVQPLNKNLVKEYKNMFALMMHRPELQDDSILVVTDVLPESPFNEMKTVHERDIVKSVNGVVVRTIQNYKRQIDKFVRAADAAALVCIELRSGQHIHARVDDCRKCNDAVVSRFKNIDI